MMKDRKEEMLKWTDTKEMLKDILVDVTWSKIAKRYFGKSPSWIHNKLSEIDDEEGKGGFTENEREQLKSALYDFSERIRRTADKI